MFSDEISKTRCVRSWKHSFRILLNGFAYSFVEEIRASRTASSGAFLNRYGSGEPILPTADVSKAGSSGIKTNINLNQPE